MLGNESILEAINRGDILIDPFIGEHLGPNSYDVRLDAFYCVQRDMNNRLEGDNYGHILSAGEKVNGDNIWSLTKSADGYIHIPSRTLILARTIERVTCRRNYVAEMKSRSTIMRSGLAVCIDAGLGDVGYDGTWTMEIFNHLNYPISIEVGSRIAQMVFHRVDGASIDYYDKGGTYSKSLYDPADMIPRSRL